MEQIVFTYKERNYLHKLGTNLGSYTLTTSIHWPCYCTIHGCNWHSLLC